MRLDWLREGLLRPNKVFANFDFFFSSTGGSTEVMVGRVTGPATMTVLFFCFFLSLCAGSASSSRTPSQSSCPLHEAPPYEATAARKGEGQGEGKVGQSEKKLTC